MWGPNKVFYFFVQKLTFLPQISYETSCILKIYLGIHLPCTFSFIKIYGSHFKLCKATPPPPPNVFIRDTHIEIVPSFKYLGLHFDQYLSWNFHVDQITKSVTKYIGLFCRIRKYLSQESLKILHNSILLPRIDYCDVVWGNCSKYLRDRIERLQTRSARAILRVPV